MVWPGGHLGLGATAGALNPLDVLVIGCQDCLQLRLEGVSLHFGIYIPSRSRVYHRALALPSRSRVEVLVH